MIHFPVVIQQIDRLVFCRILVTLGIDEIRMVIIRKHRLIGIHFKADIFSDPVTVGIQPECKRCREVFLCLFGVTGNFEIVVQRGNAVICAVVLHVNIAGTQQFPGVQFFPVIDHIRIERLIQRIYHQLRHFCAVGIFQSLFRHGTYRNQQVFINIAGLFRRFFRVIVVIGRCGGLLRLCICSRRVRLTAAVILAAAGIVSVSGSSACVALSVLIAFPGCTGVSGCSAGNHCTAAGCRRNDCDRTGCTSAAVSHQVGRHIL